MAINQNHLFEDLDGVKCAVVEKNTKQERVEFLRSLLEFNKFKVIVIPSPAPKTVVSTDEIPVDPPSTFTVGVTDVGFNATNAIFGRLLKTADGRVVTLAYWQQKEKFSDDSIPYYERNK